MNHQTKSIKTDEDWQDIVQFWRRYTGKLDTRGLRKTMLATMFSVVAIIYLGQLMSFGILPSPISEGEQLIGTPLGLIVVGGVGAAYLWRTQIRYSIEITVVALAGTYLLMRIMDGGWFIFDYIFFAVALAISYALSYIFFTTWRVPYRMKLVVAGVFIMLVVAAELLINAGGGI